MIENRQQISTAFTPYLREFLTRAKAEKLELVQVEIPVGLQSAAKSLGISFKTSFGMGTPAVIPWLGCFLPGQSAGKHGVYPVVLYRRDTNTLSVCYGVSANAQVADGYWPRAWPGSMVRGLKQFGHPKFGASFELRLLSGAEIDDFAAITDAFLDVLDD